MHWIIDDLINEFAAQIERHMEKLTNRIELMSWRTNPNVLVGCRVAVFRKGPTPVPTLLLATAIEASGLSYSRVRVTFDAPQFELDPISSMSSPTTAHSLGVGLGSKVTRERMDANQGDICEPFWVQKDPTSSWMSPDELYQQVRVLVYLYKR